MLPITPGPQQQAAAAAPPTSLPDELLARVLAKLTPDELRGAPSLVSKRWEALAGQLAFKKVTARFEQKGDLYDQLPAQLLERVRRWFAARAAYIQELQVEVKHNSGALAIHAMEGLAAGGSQPQLRCLAVDFGGGGGSDSDTEGVAELLSLLRGQPQLAGRLEALAIRAVRGPIDGYNHGGRLSLPRLRTFVLEFQVPDWSIGCEPEDCLPEGFPKFLLDCAELEELIITGDGTKTLPTLPKRLGRLQRLRKLSLIGHSVQTLPNSLTSMSSLQVLQVLNRESYLDPEDMEDSEAEELQDQPSGGMPQLQAIRLPASLAPMAQLAKVELCCPKVPMALSTLPGLKSLTLYGIGSSSEPEWDQLLAGLRLETLRLLFGRLGKMPPAVTHHATLRSLDLRDCGLADLPGGPYLQQLTELDLRNNLLRKVPPAVLAAPQLRALTLLEGEPPLNVTTAAAPAVAALNARMLQSYASESYDADSQRRFWGAMGQVERDVLASAFGGSD